MIAFVVLHYQAFDETKACIETIKKRVSSMKRIVIVDNSSPNESGVKLQNFYKNDSEVEVLLLNSNLGFAKGNNLGYKIAKRYSPQYIVVMNNDIFIESGDLEERLDDAYEQYSFDVLGPDIYSTRDRIHQNPQRMENLSYDGLILQQRFLRLKNKLRFLLRIKYMFPSLTRKRRKIMADVPDIPIGNVVLHGACYIYSEKYINFHENCFYNETFMYYESYIFHMLAGRENLILIYDPRIKVLHHEDVSTDMTFGEKYAKADFTNKCLFESCNIFIRLMNDLNIRIG